MDSTLTINIAVVLLYLSFIVMAYRKGFLYEALHFLMTIASLFIGYLFSPPLAKIMPLFHAEQFEEVVLKYMTPYFNLFIWFIGLFIVVRFVFLLLLPVSKSFSKIPVLGTLNRLAGILFGILNATIMAMMLSMLLSMPMIPGGVEVREKSLLKPISALSNQALDMLSKKVDVSSFDQNVQAGRDAFSEWLIQLKEGVISHEE